MTEKQIIERCKQGDSSAFSQIYEKYASKMLGVCYRYVNDLETAHDLMHDGFITVFTKIGDYRNEGSFEGWMRRVFVTTALGYLRKYKLYIESKNNDFSLPNMKDNDPSVLEKISEQELIRLIKSLPNGYRTILNLYTIEGYSHREIAEMLHISEGTSRFRYARAKALLNKRLVEHR